MRMGVGDLMGQHGQADVDVLARALCCSNMQVRDFVLFLTRLFSKTIWQRTE